MSRKLLFCALALYFIGLNAKVDQETKAKIMNYNVDNIMEDYQKKIGASYKEVRKVEKEFKRFFVIMKDFIDKKKNSQLAEHEYSSPEGEGLAPLRMPCSECDRIWHKLLKQTKQYRDFCNETMGEFIDHRELEAFELEKLDKIKERELQKRLYEENFGEAPPEDLWDRLYKKQTLPDGFGFIVPNDDVLYCVKCNTSDSTSNDVVVDGELC